MQTVAQEVAVADSLDRWQRRLATLFVQTRELGDPVWIMRESRPSLRLKTDVGQRQAWRPRLELPVHGGRLPGNPSSEDEEPHGGGQSPYPASRRPQAHLEDGREISYGPRYSRGGDRAEASTRGRSRWLARQVGRRVPRDSLL